MTESENKKVLKKILHEFELIKIDALGNILRARHFLLSLLWTCLLIVSASVCTWLIVGTFQQYYSKQVSTTTRYVSDSRVAFPTVLVCNMNPFVSDYALNLLRAANVAFSTLTGFGTINGNYVIYSQLEGYLLAQRGFYMTMDEKRQLSDIDQFLLDCRFGNVPCSSHDFEFIFHPSLFPCYRFNTNATQVVSAPGPTSQLTLTLYVGVPDPLNITYQHGLFALVLNASAYPKDYKMSPTMVTPGHGVFMTVNRKFYKQYPTPYSDCNVLDDGSLVDGAQLSDRSLFDATLTAGFDYSQQTCLLFCQQQYTASACNCLNLLIEYEIPGYNYCADQNQLSCMHEFYLNFTKDDYINRNCLTLCPLECDQRVLEQFASSYKFPASVNYVRQVRANPALIAKLANQSDFTDNLATSIVQLSIIYGTLAYTHVEEEPKMTAEDLIGILGGHLHLFMGMSLLSFVECAEVICFALVTFFSSAFRPNKKKVSSRQEGVEFQLRKTKN